MSVGEVLVLHSDHRVRDAARKALERAGYSVSSERAAAGAASRSPDLVLLEWTSATRMEPLLAQWKSSDPGGSGVRVVVLAAAEEWPAALSALDLGAEDCVRVPLEPAAELVARVRAALRRPPLRTAGAALVAGPIVLDRAVHAFAVGGRAVELAPTEFRLLAFFMENPDRVFSRSELLRRAWTRDLGESQQRTVDVHVRRLRQVLERFGCEHMIQTVRGFGYRFSAAGAPVASPTVRALPARAGNA